jgi:type IV pilus assembly protein PilW
VRSRGFTLIELMVSMALFGLIAAGAMSLVVSGARTQSHSARVDVAQTSLRAAMDFITRDVLSASAGASTGMIMNTAGLSVPAVDFTTTTQNITSGAPYASGTDKLDLYNTDASTLAQIPLATGAGATTAAPTMLTSVSQYTQFVSTSSPYNSYVQISDFTNAAIAQLTNATSTTLTLANLKMGFGVNAWVMPSRHVVYQVSDTQFTVANASLQNNTMLMMSVNGSAFQPLAEGIEDMQIAYGFDTNSDGVVTEVGTAADDDEWLYNKTGDTVKVTFTIANLRKIRVTLIAKSTSVDSGQTNFPGRPAAEDHAASGTATDGFVRRILRTEIAVRNFNP